MEQHRRGCGSSMWLILYFIQMTAKVYSLLLLVLWVCKLYHRLHILSESDSQQGAAKRSAEL